MSVSVQLTVLKLSSMHTTSTYCQFELILIYEMFTPRFREGNCFYMLENNLCTFNSATVYHLEIVNVAIHNTLSAMAKILSAR